VKLEGSVKKQVFLLVNGVPLEHFPQLQDPQFVQNVSVGDLGIRLDSPTVTSALPVDLVFKIILLNVLYVLWEHFPTRQVRCSANNALLVAFRMSWKQPLVYHVRLEHTTPILEESSALCVHLADLPLKLD
jgi:hypothetical protein